jgi:SGNH domain (fused to AT3 domains)
MLAWSQYAGYLDRAVQDSRFWANLSSLVGVLLVAAAITLLDQSQPFPGWRALIPVTGALLVIAAGPSALFNRALLGAKPIVAIGLISYPLYLWHWPLLSLIRIVDESSPPPMLIASAVAVAVLLATLTYFFVEKPIRRLPVALCAPMLAGLMFVVASVGGLVAIKNGVPARMEALQEQVARVKWASESDPLCQDLLPVKSRYCRISDPQRPVTAVIIGDSHANRLFEGLSPRFAENNGNLLQLGEGGCLPFWELEGGAEGESDNCRQRMNGQLNFVLSEPAIGIVFLLARGPLYISGHGYGDVEKNTRTFLRRPGEKAKSAYNDLYEKALAETVNRLLAAGKKVVFVIDNPELGFDPLSCIQSRPVQLSRTPRAPCAVRTAMVEARNEEYRQIVGRVAARSPALIVVDSQRALCDKKYCWAMIDGDLLYMDGDHLNRAGAKYVADQMNALLFVPAQTVLPIKD